MPEFNLTRKQAIAYDFLSDSVTTEIGYGGGAGGGLESLILVVIGFCRSV